MRKSVVDRRVYRPQGIDPVIREEILDTVELNRTREKIRNNVEQKGVMEANALLDDNFAQPFHCRPGAYAKVSVQIQEITSAENGCQRTFEPFYTDRENARAGPGMASVFGIVKKHEGLITVNSDAQGSSFSIFLPAMTVAR